MDAMRVPKRPFAATVGLPPFRLAGTMHVPESVESPAIVVTVNPDAFIAMTDATITCRRTRRSSAPYPVVAFQRRRAHVLLVGIDDEDPDGCWPRSSTSGQPRLAAARRGGA